MEERVAYLEGKVEEHSRGLDGVREAVVHLEQRMDGEVTEMTPIGPRQASCVRRLIAILSPLVGDAAILDVQNPLPLGPRAEPQPDVVLLKPRPDLYGQAHPGPSDVLLVIEVADTSAEYDRTLNVPQYARAGIAEL